MIISVNWLKKYVDIDDVDELTQRIGARLVEIENVQRLGDKYRASKATAAKVVECVSHPDSDHLHICKIDDGGLNDVPRDDNNHVQVVCGAPNIETGQTVVWLPPSAVVPETYGTSDEFTLTARKLRGVLSQGMIASPCELDLWNEHEGIMVIDDPTIKPGDQLIDILDLDDCLLEVENKSLTHRPDCFGIIGFAREVAAILGKQALLPNWFTDLDGELSIDDEQLIPSVTIANNNLCTRYECVAIDGVSSMRAMPDKYRNMLYRLGTNTISPIVDVANYVMFETGQPLHTFDLDKVIELSPTGRADIIVRAGNKGETLELLDGRTIELDIKDIVIAVGNMDDSMPIALAGAMGGLATEVTEKTKRVLLESATFDLYHLRGTQFRHGIFSEAITRFTKGQPADLTHSVLLQAVAMMKQLGNVKVISPVVDNYQQPVNPYKFSVSTDQFTAILGEYSHGGYTANLIETTLNNLGYINVINNGDNIQAVAPWWRTDLHIIEDVVEDVGRVNGYDNIIGTLPTREYVAARYDKLYLLQTKLRKRLQQAGGNEVLTYSFVHGDLLDKVGDDKKQAYRIVNAISPDLQYYRRDLLPNLLEIGRDNLRAGYDNFMLFELGKVHRQGIMDESEPLPAELSQLAGVIIDKTKHNDSAYYTAKKVVKYVLDAFDSRISYVRLDRINDNDLDSSINVFEPMRSAALYVDINGEEYYIGVIGELKAGILRSFKLPSFTAGFSIMLDKLANLNSDNISSYTPVFRYQGTSRDITYQTDVDVNYKQLADFTVQTLVGSLSDNIVAEVTPKDIYQLDSQMINTTIHIDFHDRDATINAKLVNKAMDKLAKQATAHLGAKVI